MIDSEEYEIQGELLRALFEVECAYRRCRDDAPLFAGATTGQNTTRLLAGWEYHVGSLGGPWDIWKGQSAGDHVSEQVVSLPHCFNARKSAVSISSKGVSTAFLSVG